MKKKIEPEYIGSWRIIEMSNWNKKARDRFALARLTIRPDGLGTLAFYSVQAKLDCRMDEVGVAEHLAYKLRGTDEGNEVSGRGWAVAITKNRMEGEFLLHSGDRSTFQARRKVKRSAAIAHQGK